MRERERLLEEAIEAYAIWKELEEEDGIKPLRIIWAMERLRRVHNNGERLMLLPEDGRGGRNEALQIAPPGME